MRSIVDVASGDVVQYISYDEFGNILTDTNPCFQPFGYVGGIFDENNALLRFGMRDYNSHIGRWTVKDPFKLKRNIINQYRYVSNDPINKIDPIGLWEYQTDIPHTNTNGDGLTENITSIETTVDDAFQSVAGRDATITYTTNGTHTAANTRHYVGDAIDLRIRDLTDDQIDQVLEQLIDGLGEDYDVVDERDLNHIHIEYDPAPISPCPRNGGYNYGTNDMIDIMQAIENY